MGERQVGGDGFPDFREHTILRARDLRQIVKELTTLGQRVSELEARAHGSKPPPVTDLRFTPTALLLPSSGLVRYPYRVEELGSARRDLTARATITPVQGPGGCLEVDGACLIPLRTGPAYLRVQCEELDVEVSIRIHDCRQDLTRSVRLYRDGESRPIVLTDQPAARVRTPTKFVWAQDETLPFHADDPGFEEVDQRINEKVLADLQSSDGHLFAALILVRCLPRPTQVEVLAPGSQLRSNRELTIPAVRGRFFDASMVVWEGRVTELRFMGPSIIGIARVDL